MLINIGGDGMVYFGVSIRTRFLSNKSYIPTNGSSQATRSAETANNSGDASTFNDSEGVLMAEISALAKDNNYELISISNGYNLHVI